jgi:hypothetical protein
MIVGFNTNARYRGRMFHVQTEDSGLKHPHVISHLYYEGSILGSQKSGYAERVGTEDLEIHVRALMERQHKDMLRRLKGGDFDGVIAERLDHSASTEPAFESEPAFEPEPAPSPPPPVATAEPTVLQAPVPDPEDRPASASAEKPLDEVIFDYLVDKSRGRSASGGRSKE